MYLSVASTKQKVHLYSVKVGDDVKTEFENAKSNLAFLGSVSTYYGSDFSFAQFKLPEDSRSPKIC